MVVKLRPNTPRQLLGVGFSLSPYTLVGFGYDLDLDLEPDLDRLLEYLPGLECRDLLRDLDLGVLDLDPPGLGDLDPGDLRGGEGDLL